MNILWIMNSTGTVAWRVTPVAQALRDIGHTVEAVNIPRFSADQLTKLIEWADVIVFQMVANKTLLNMCKEAGVATVFDCDDLIDEVPPKHPQFEKTAEKAYQSLFRYMIKNVDVMTVSSQPLYENYKKLQKNIYVLPNYLPTEFWERPYAPNTSNKLRIGWAGGVSHAEDLDFIAPVITRVLGENSNAKLVYTGGGGWANNQNNPNDFIRYGEDSFPEISSTRREYNQGCRIELWPDRLNSMRLDIALAPLEKNRFSEHKTHIKYFEYAINRWPGVYQKFLYGDVVEHGKTGFLATTREEWLYYIDELVKDPKLREQMGAAAYIDTKKNHSFSGERADLWVNTYRDTVFPFIKKQQDQSGILF